MAKSALTFLPYIKRQSSLQIQRNAGQLTAALNLEIIDKDGNRHQLTPHTLTFRGPGSVIGITEKIIARREPKPNTYDFEPNYFPFIEFIDPDFPWRYSLDVINNQPSSVIPNQMRPWVSLIILSQTEINEMASENIEVIAPLDNMHNFLSVKLKYLPNLDLAWSTAHTQFSGLDRSIEQFLESNPSNHCSRIFCFRRLQPETRYMAFLLPNYKIAAQAAFGLNTENIAAEPAWQSMEEEDVIKLPIYSYWQFGTSEKGDFQSLAQALTYYELNNNKVGTRAIHANLTNSSDDRSFLMEGALASPKFLGNRIPFFKGSNTLLSDLNETLKTSAEHIDPSDPDDEDPLITSPVYGRYFRKIDKIKMPYGNVLPSMSPWINELNLDLRNRVSAGFGTKVIQNKQDEYMKKCWLQVGEIRKANEKIRRAQAAVILSEVLDQKHFKHLSDERFAMLSSPFHKYYEIEQSGSKVIVNEALRNTGVSPGVFATDFRRMAHNRININRVTSITSLNNAISSSKIEKTNQSTSETDYSSFAFGGDYAKQKSEVIAVKPVDFGNEFRSLFNARKTIKAKLEYAIKLKNGQFISDNFDPIMAAPKIKDPMNRQLIALSENYILPGIEFLENNGITLAMENRIFIEGFMVGLSHEMGRELLWRHFFTDLAGTIFQYFWDPTEPTIENSQGDVISTPMPDIKEIHKWTSVLGKNKDQIPSEPNLVLVIKGDLIRRYPATIIYAMKINNSSGQPKFWSEEYRDSNPPFEDDTMIQPIFRANVGEDIIFVGFPFSLTNVKGSDRDGEYYFVLQENQDLPRFGLEVAGERIRQNITNTNINININNINDFSWNQVQLDHAGYISNFEFLDTNTDTSAKIANKTYQIPIRVAVHASNFLT